MKLSECTIGTIVVQSRVYSVALKSCIGHIVGLEVNSTGEVIPIIQFAQPYRPFTQPKAPNDPIAVHHANLDRLVD